MKLVVLLCCAGAIMAGCELSPLGGFGTGTPPDAPRVAVASPDGDTPRPEARPDGSRDMPDTPGNAGAAALGTTLASLGSPTEQGLWLRTGLVTRVEPGRVVRTDGGGALRVELRPSGAPPGAGSQLSLAAFRALDVPLTQLLPLEVFAE
ncbi:D-galactarate dehydratase [Roseibaca calidilacus]|nr:D-galactarate dehydratase [Roseibaca calidilacus]